MSKSVDAPRTRGDRPTLFRQALGTAWDRLPPAVRRLHSVQDLQSFYGHARVDRGTGLIARFAAWFFRFPCAGDGVPVTVTKARTPSGETWERVFAGRAFRSHLTPSPRPHCVRERFWLLNYELNLPVTDGALRLEVRRGWFLGLPMPRWLLPGSDSREFSRDGVFHFDVGLYAPLSDGLLVRYRGALRLEKPNDSDDGS